MPPGDSSTQGVLAMHAKLAMHALHTLLPHVTCLPRCTGPTAPAGCRARTTHPCPLPAVLLHARACEPMLHYLVEVPTPSAPLCPPHTLKKRLLSARGMLLVGSSVSAVGMWYTACGKGGSAWARGTEAVGHRGGGSSHARKQAHRRAGVRACACACACACARV